MSVQRVANYRLDGDPVILGKLLEKCPQYITFRNGRYYALGIPMDERRKMEEHSIKTAYLSPADVRHLVAS